MLSPHKHKLLHFECSDNLFSPTGENADITFTVKFLHYGFGIYNFFCLNFRIKNFFKINKMHVSSNIEIEIDGDKRTFESRAKFGLAKLQGCNQSVVCVMAD